MKNKTKILCFVLWGVCLFGVFHIQYLQKLEAQKIDKDNQEDYHETNVRSSYERADNGKKNIINILILIIQNN